jgi:RNA polymerase sigma factor (sigma-70 family)
MKELRRVLDHLRLAGGGGLSDGQLLGRFIDGREEAAFAALLRRHGPMVLGVCRRLLRHAQDAEDAFQATFLLLASKAASVVKREAVASWLYGVAYRTALRAKVQGAKRRSRERLVEEMPHREVAPAEVQDWRPLLDRELNRLPEKYRAPLLLCDLEGRPRREAARQLRLPEGTLASRLATARRLLAKRLARRGVSLSGGALAVVLTEAAPAAVPASLASSTVKAAVLVAAGQMAAVTPAVVTLMKEVSKIMFMTKLKLSLAAVMVVALLGTSGLVYQAAGQAPKAADRPLTDLELLHREVEILKLQVEVLQSEMRTLRGRGAVEKAASDEPVPLHRGARGASDKGTGPNPYAKDPASSGPKTSSAEKGAGPTPFAKDPTISGPKTPAGDDVSAGRAPNTTDPNVPRDSSVEDELRKLRDATDDPVMREKLDRIISRLRDRARPKGFTPELAK